MKMLFGLMLMASGFAVPRPGDHTQRWPVRERETIEKTLSLSAEPMRLVVDNVSGYVHVTGASGSQVHVTAHKTIYAEADADWQRAKSEVKLEISQRPGSVNIYYDAPWRCNNQSDGCHDHDRRFYSVAYDIDVEVPREAKPVISTVNDGDIRVEGTAGDFNIKNVNGAIGMSGIAGSGEARTVNGPVTVRFAKNPSAASTFGSINGQLNFYFQPPLSADLRFKTFNGEIYSDFEVSPMALALNQGERQNGKFIYRSGGVKGGRAGQGGPELTFDALNGDIRLHRATPGDATHE